MMNLYAPFTREATQRVTMTLRSEGHGGDPSPKLQGDLQKARAAHLFSCLALLALLPLGRALARVALLLRDEYAA